MAVYRNLISSNAQRSASVSADLLEAVLSGQLVILPTDTVYGIGSDPFSSRAVSRLLGAKGRDETMPPPVLGANPRSLLELATFESAEQERQVQLVAETLWPGPLTLILRTNTEFGWDTSLVGGTVALRMPACEEALFALRATGPLAVTSANRTGQPPAASVEEARDYFGDEVALYVDGGVLEAPRPSTVVDLTGSSPRLVRRGEITMEQILELLPSI